MRPTSCGPAWDPARAVSAVVLLGTGFGLEFRDCDKTALVAILGAEQLDLDVLADVVANAVRHAKPIEVDEDVSK